MNTIVKEQRESEESSLKIALAYASAGHPVFPCKPDKRPFTKNGFKDATTDPQKVAEYWTQHPSALIGMPTGAASGLFVLDLDVNRESGERVGEASLSAVGLSELLSYPIQVITPSGGRHIYFEHDAKLGSTVGRVGVNIDTRGSGGYVIAPGADGYRWAEGSILKNTLPVVPAALRTALVRRSSEPPARLHAPSNVIPISRLENMASELELVRTIEHAANGCTWAERALMDECRLIMAAMPGTRNHSLNCAAFSLGQIIAGGGLDRGATEVGLTLAARRIGLDDAEISKTIASAFGAGAIEPRSASRREAAISNALVTGDAVASRKATLAMKVVRANNVRPLLASPYLVKGWFDLEAMSVVYGESNVGKSFFALDIAHHVSKGVHWAGARVIGGPVFYIASEGGRSFVNRVAALDGPSERLVVIPVAVDLCGSALDAEAIIALIKDEAEVHGEPALVIIDTLARSMGQGDENTAPDMGAFVRSIDMIRDETSAHVMVIHHSGKDRAKGARGHSSLRAATDTEIELTASSDVIVAEAKKQRDMVNGRRFAYRLLEVDLGQDQDGDAVTTCRVEPCDLPDKTTAAPLTIDQRRVLEALRQFIGDHGVPNPGGTGWPEPGTRMTVDQAAFKRFAAKKELDADEPKKASRRVRDMLSKIQDKGIIQSNEGYVWIVSKSGNVGA